MKMLVLGAAVSGRAAARLGRTLGNDVSIYDERLNAVSTLGAEFEVHAGEWRSETLDEVELVVTSPGFPEHQGALPDVLSAGIPLVSEMEFAAAQLTTRYAAVTGTNGKTTVTSVAADMLRGSGIDAVAAGNIGTALSDIVLDPPDVVVIEASSFQLRFIDRFHPSAAAILNIAPDHLDWHEDLGEYTAAKQRIFQNQSPDDILVYDADDDGASAAVEPARARLVPVSGSHLPAGGSGPDGANLIIGNAIVARPDLDRAYTMDLVAAATIASHLGASAQGIGRAISSFAPGDHRRAVIGRWNGVTWVNDSKATNPHAAVASVEAFPSVVLIAGGRNKGLDLSAIVAVPGVRKVIGIGEAATEFAAATDADKFSMATGLADAVAIADSLARSGDTVLLAPGCASFDMFESYAARGNEFARLIHELKGEPNGN
ncbi:MAG: UDP-N-acetylmuramoyl-L-alanine--D-glutamate ligase [Actinomycetota bacterium]|nr:UDP-N-acetylmuramoyl-L-alanine--D-glutamate ligase [Actinomycetota bacterium]